MDAVQEVEADEEGNNTTVGKVESNCAAKTKTPDEEGSESRSSSKAYTSAAWKQCIQRGKWQEKRIVVQEELALEVGEVLPMCVRTCGYLAPGDEKRGRGRLGSVHDTNGNKFKFKFVHHTLIPYYQPLDGAAVSTLGEAVVQGKKKFFYYNFSQHRRWNMKLVFLVEEVVIGEEAEEVD